MDFLSNFAKSAEPKSDSDKEKPASTGSSGLVADAKLVAEAAQAQFQGDKYDKGKVAGAGANLLEAASGYAKLDETKGIGKYVDQAGGYLRKYDTHPAADEQKPPASDPHAEQKTPATDAPAVQKDSGEKGAESEKSSGGAGDYVKMAQGFLNKQSGEKTTEDSSEGGYGDLMKMAGGFLKK